MKHYTLFREYLPGITVGTVDLSTCEKVATIELPWNDNKVGKSCIPEGEYLVQRDKFGKHTWFRIPEVKGRTFIEIHEGSRPQHSLGCVLLDKVDLQDWLLDCNGEDFKLTITS